MRIAEFLLDIGAVQLSVAKPFTWTSGLKSPIYCDNRMIYSHPVARSLIADALADRIRALHIEPDVVAGTATAAIGWGALAADRLDLPFVYVRKETKGHGGRKQVEGDIPEEKHVVIVEDLISTGGSAVLTAGVLRSETKSVVTDVVSIFSYELEESMENALAHKLQFHPLTSVNVLLAAARGQDRISKDEEDHIRRFIADPGEWKI